MFEEFMNNLFKEVPVWFIILALTFGGVVKYGPKFFKDMISIAEKYKDKSDTVKNEFIAMLQMDKQRLQKEKDELKKKIEKLESKKK